MNLSGILVVVAPENLDEGVRALSELPGIDVHHTDPGTGRIVVTQEAETVEAEVEGLRRIQEMPLVVLAELVQHHVEQEP